MPKLAVLISGSGTNLQAIINAINLGQLNCVIDVVIADRPCVGLERAYQAGIKALMVDRKVQRGALSSAIAQLIAADCSLVVLAGFLSILDEGFIEKWAGRIINIHPSLLPKYGGVGMWGDQVHAAVLANNERESGCTVHLVTSEIDKGAVIAQARVPVMVNDDINSLKIRVQQVEHSTLIAAIKQLVTE